MDELEFRRRLFADPNDKDVVAQADTDPAKQRLVKEMQDFDATLHSALDISVPDDLAQKILAKQQADTDTSMQQTAEVKQLAWYRRFKAPLATAASALLAVSLYFATSVHAPLHAGEHALQHVYYEAEALALTREVQLQEVNEKLAMFGGKLEAMPGKVTYATFCNFKGQRSLHLIFQSDHGPVTVFIVPTDNDDTKSNNERFADGRFSGSIKPGDRADTILVANLDTPLEQYQTAVTESLRWL
ncbi:DUF3379 family protein [Pseudoalteromonas ardens]|uniref:DUF3379 domain-containing protein n=1 Tax=Pseudoalteromonas rubra TaxID=43658 RepID=A0A0L0EWF5_9GAMM|nr:DUF3379 family protein [Pseudoalteromonas sp. R96]KNC68781.1 hypothetical protein AC626_02575 [Pseudoalteromonas rubra]MDK1311373.1 DUF3379 family protein [Pseudoalteromonas sp. R96]